MKKISLFTCFLLIISLPSAFIAVENLTEPADTEELATVCDYINAFDLILDDMFGIIGDTEPDQLNKSQVDRLKEAMDNLTALGDEADKKFGKDEEEAMKCEKFNIVDEKIQKISPYLLYLMANQAEEEEKPGEEQT